MSTSRNFRYKSGTVPSYSYLAKARRFAVMARVEESMEMAQSLMVSAATHVTAGPAELCDRCGVPAKLGFVLPTGGQLAFCGHHANTYTDTILAMAESVFLEHGFEWIGAAVESTAEYVGAHRAGAHRG
jgi:hypothetical protein